MFGEWVSEFKSGVNGGKPLNEVSKKDKSKEKAKVTTLATNTAGSASSTAGPPSTVSAAGSQKQKTQCDFCDVAGHFIRRCFKFKKLKRDEKLDVIKKNNLCFCCLKTGHG